MISKEFIKRINETITIEGQNLINEFFVTFSRFECALKTSGFANGDVEKVNPNWDAFAASIRQSFDSEVRTELMQNAIDYLSNYPPRVQNFENGRLGWRERVFLQNEPLINRLSLSIRDIRNNLFHGGKFNGVYQEDVSRNYILLHHSMVLLNNWLILSQPVREKFIEPIAITNR
ncbi:MAG TPA: hypothetical protein VFG10_14155 [Saprospiraceae bacterium]|nr:hypothetical protein [Saprospiraceae bacterium]